MVRSQVIRLFVLILLTLPLSNGQPSLNSEAEPVEHVKITTFNQTSIDDLEFLSLQTHWPLKTDHWEEELNLTSTFGPRQKASSNFRYDYHRGIDLPASYGTPVYAIDDGTVRLASINATHEQRNDGSIGDIYTSTVIQVKHNNTEFNQNKGRQFYYSNYLHINGSKVEVNAGEDVTKGQLIGYIGDDPNSNIPHLHFEIREDGLFRRHATHPLQFLPNSNQDLVEIDTLGTTGKYVDESSLTFLVNISREELDFKGFNITGNLDGTEVDITWDMVELNHETKVSDSLDNEVYILNDTSIIVYPEHYSNYKLYALYNVTIDFSELVFSEIKQYDLVLDVYDIFNTGKSLRISNEETSSSIASNLDDTTSLITVSRFLIPFFLVPVLIILIRMLTKRSQCSTKI